jgi:1-acyl-sn-glycerol-3-phosphate acyltransferase
MENPYVKRHSLLVYPEGTRNNTLNPLPLKHGFTKVTLLDFPVHDFIKNSWIKSIPIQVILSYGLDEIVAEKKFKLKIE